MTESTAEKMANAVVGVAVAGAAVYVLRSPSLRRAVFRFAAVALTATLPAWFRQEIEHGWRESAPGITPADPA